MTGNEVNETAVETEAGQTAEAAPEQAPEQAAEPAPEQVPEPAAEPAAEPAVDSTAESAAEEPAVDSAAEAAPERKTVRRVFGHVVSNGADKTVSVSIERVVRHPVYGKYIRRTTRVMAHDEDNACRLGDRVAIAECRPLSKRKSWRVVEVFAGNGAPQ